MGGESSGGGHARQACAWRLWYPVRGLVRSVRGVATVGACLCVPCVAAELHTGATHRGAWVSVR